LIFPLALTFHPIIAAGMLYVCYPRVCACNSMCAYNLKE
jgi:hypothetical protein